MWNEFEYVEDGRFDPNRDGEHGEYRDENYNYNFDEDDEDGEDDSDDDSFDVEPEEKVDMFRKMYPMVSGILDKGRKDLYYNTEGKNAMQKKISGLTNLKTVLWGYIFVFLFIGLLVNLMTTQVDIETIGTIILLFLVSLWRFWVNYRNYKSPEYQTMQEKARRDVAEYKEFAERRRKAGAEEKQEKPQKSNSKAGKVAAVTGIALGYFCIGTIAELTSKYMKKK